MSFTHPLALLLALPLGIVAVLVWRYGFDNLGTGRRRVALGLRLGLLVVLVLGLAGATLQLSQPRESVVFLADLSASDVGKRTEMGSTIGDALRSRPHDDVAGVVVVGRQPLVDQPVSPLNTFPGFQSQVDADYTDLESGLELSGAIMPDGYRRRVVVLSDGQQNIGDALSAARLLRSQGVRVDTVPVRAPGGPEALVTGVHMPAQLRPHERFTLSIGIHATQATSAKLDLYRDRTLISTRTVAVPAGASQVEEVEGPLTAGFHSFQARLTPLADTQYQNNAGSASTTVQGPPRVLVLAAQPSEAANVVAGLRSTGMKVDLQAPSDVPPTLGYLQRYSSVVIVDTAADVLGPQLQSQLLPYVRDLGRGLVVIGGQQAFGMGGYGGTPLERALPVKMDLPKRKDLPSAAVVLIVESLEADLDVNISKAAAKGVVNLLTEGDQVAVNDTPWDNSAGWAVRMQHVRDKAAIDRAIDNMQPGDPVSYAPYLRSAYKLLKGTRARVKHIILLGDGDAEDPAYTGLLKQFRAGGVTVSTVATNGQGFADFQTMRDIARLGGGRYYRADNSSSIPKIFLREARNVARSGIITGKFYPQQLSDNPMLRDTHAIPPLYGYVATTPKPTGEIVLASKKLDPVLAGWQLGLGRSVAWTSDASGLWTKDWLAAPGAGRFWSDLVAWTFPPAAGGQLSVATTSAAGQGRISVSTPSTLGAAPGVTAQVVGPDLRRTTVDLQPDEPGHYTGSFLARGQGSYFVTVEARGSGHAEAGQATLDIPYSAEYLASGSNVSFMRDLAAAGGGSILRSPSDAWLNNLASVDARRPLTAWLALLALLLLLLDVAVRRLIVTRTDLAVILAALPGRKPAGSDRGPSVSALGALRRERARRSERAGKATAPISEPALAHAAGEVRVRTQATARPLDSPAPPRETGTAAADRRPSPPPDPAEADEETTAARLLRARRRGR